MRIRDWSSDGCSADLARYRQLGAGGQQAFRQGRVGMGEGRGIVEPDQACHEGSCLFRKRVRYVVMMEGECAGFTVGNVMLQGGDNGAKGQFRPWNVIHAEEGGREAFGTGVDRKSVG